jgi:DNA-directed RNA polymerase specialized sigma24 family protein
VACIERHGSEVHALARRLGVADEDADAVVRAIFRALWHQAGRGRRIPEDERTFVIQVARREALDHLAARGPRVSGAREAVADEAPGEERGRPQQSSLFGDSGRVARALGQLEPDERAALEPIVLRALSYPRVAFLTGLPTAIVRDAARRGLVRVRELLHCDAASPPEEAQT